MSQPAALTASGPEAIMSRPSPLRLLEEHPALASADDIRIVLRILKEKYEPSFAPNKQKSTVGMVLESTLKITGIVPGGPLDKDFDGASMYFKSTI